MVGTRVTVGDIAAGINEAFPYTQAEKWDNVGLLLGTSAQEATGVVCALDPTLEILEYAHNKGANVVLTHHPAFIEAPHTFSDIGPYCGRVIKQAAQYNIALIAAHTNLDASDDARRILGETLGLMGYHEAFVSVDNNEEPRVSRYAVLWQTSCERSLAEMARLVHQAFGVKPRVYGDKQKKVVSVMTSTGAGSDHVNDAIAAHADVFITGEVKYHDALAAKESGVAVIELGHDVSEWPLVGLLKEALMAHTFMDPTRIYDAPRSYAWWVETGEINV